MERRAPIANKAFMSTHSYVSKQRVDKTIELAKKLAEDDEKAKRLEQQKCKACHYFPRMAGQAFTSQECAGCGEMQTYSSTATDVFCKSCAAKHDLCRCCGGDIEMKAGRRDWPEFGKVMP